MTDLELKYWRGEFDYRQDNAGDITELEGFASTPTIDSFGDMVLPQAFARTLPGFLERGVIIYQHDWNEPVGRPIDARILDEGLWIRAQLSDTQRGKDVKQLIRDGVLRELSIGFQYVDAVRWTEELAQQFGLTEVPSGYLVRDVELYEVSLVTRASNPTARITNFRADEVQHVVEKQLTNPQNVVYSIRVPAWLRRTGGKQQ